MICQERYAENLDGEDFCASCGGESGAVQTITAVVTEGPIDVDEQTTSAPNDNALGDVDAPVVPSGMFSAWKMVFSKYFNRKGRASRTEFWYWRIFLFILFGIPAIYLGYELFLNMFRAISFHPILVLPAIDDPIQIHDTPVIKASYEFEFRNPSLGVGVLAWVIIGAFFLLCPNINLLVRRVHDFNLSGWFVLLIFIPILGVLIPYVFGFIPGTNGPNKYGPKPMKR